MVFVASFSLVASFMQYLFLRFHFSCHENNRKSDFKVPNMLKTAHALCMFLTVFYSVSSFLTLRLSYHASKLTLTMFLHLIQSFMIY